MNRYSRVVYRTCFIVRRFIYQPNSQLTLIITTNTDDHIQFVSKCRTDTEVKPAYQNVDVLSLKQIISLPLLSEPELKPRMKYIMAIIES